MSKSAYKQLSNSIKYCSWAPWRWS